MATAQDYPWHSVIGTRWMDCDAYGHVNNVVYYSWMDTAVTQMLYARGVLGAQSASIGLCVASGCDFHAPVEFPGDVTVGVAIERLGTSSIRYRVAIFAGADTPAANGHFTHVYVDRQTRKPNPIGDQTRATLSDLVSMSV
jgi:acyl-CoA thioester hydrolase